MSHLGDFVRSTFPLRAQTVAIGLRPLATCSYHVHSSIHTHPRPLVQFCIVSSVSCGLFSMYLRLGSLCFECNSPFALFLKYLRVASTRERRLAYRISHPAECCIRRASLHRLNHLLVLLYLSTSSPWVDTSNSHSALQLVTRLMVGIGKDYTYFTLQHDPLRYINNLSRNESDKSM